MVGARAERAPGAAQPSGGLARSARRRIRGPDEGRAARVRAVGAVQRQARRRHDPRSGRADHPDRRRGRSFRQTGSARAGAARAGRRSAGDRAVERAGDPGLPRAGDPARLRQYNNPQGFGALPADARADRRGIRRCRFCRRCRQSRHQCPRRRCRGRRCADRSSGGTAHQLHGLDRSRQDRRAPRGGAI